jgi:C4-dicarboxylate transporter DctM subunit
VELTSIQIGILMLALAVGLMIIGFPVAVTMLIAGLLGTVLIRGYVPAMSALAYVPWRQSLKEILVIIPLFTWMGVMAARGGVSTDAFTSVYKWVGHLRGGLAMAVSAASAAFGAVCGNHIATAVTMTKIALPEMRRYNYQDSFSLGTIASSGNLGIMIPPSGAFVLFGFLTMTSIGKLFIAGVLPGLFVLGLFWIQIAVQTRLNPSLGPAGPRVGWIARLKSTYLLLPILVAFIVVIGGIYTGVFTPTEGACFGCLIMLVIGVVRRRLNVKGIIQSLQETMPVSAMIMLMLVTAWLFSGALTLSGLPQAITDSIAGLGVSGRLILVLMMVVYLVAGTIMDIYAVLIITLPIFFPIVLALGFDPLHFGVLCVLSVMAGSISPPFGILVYALHGMNRDVPMFTIFRGVMPFFVTLVISIFIIIFIPQLATFLPSH